ncbi:MAG: hypothetical protein LBJ10_11055, partial [Clostridiales bacterium]|nr:hypothetical protein [Clostridiales bacterium]
SVGSFSALVSNAHYVSYVPSRVVRLAFSSFAFCKASRAIFVLSASFDRAVCLRSDSIMALL